MATMSVTEARARLPELLDLVLDGEEVTITRHGKPVALIVRPDSRPEWRKRLSPQVAQGLSELEARMDEVRGKSFEELGPGLTPEFAEELIAEIRAGRDSRG